MRDSTFVVKEEAVAYGSVLLADRCYQPGEVLARFDDAVPAPRSYRTVQVGPGLHVEVHFLRHLNHSCRPNTVLDVEARTVTARLPIEPGDVLTFFYPSTEWEMAQPFICQCGAPDCIGIVAGARYLPPATLGRYFVNRHVREAIVAELAPRFATA